jgi:FkbM family methyltransferase
VGDYSAELIRVFPDLELHVFEPATTILARLKTRFVQHAQVSLQQAALSDAAGRMTLFADRDGSGMASLAQRQLSHLDIRFAPMEEVEVRRFDSYWKQALSGRFIDVVKIDVEGYELMVLRGFGDAIRNVHVLQFEFGGTNIDTKVFFRDLWHFFEEAGFDLYRITPLGLMRIEHYHERDELFIIANFIAVNRSLRG